MLEDNGTLRMLHVLVQAHTWPARAKDAGERRLAHLDRLSAHVGTVQLQQVEGEEKGGRFVPALT